RGSAELIKLGGNERVWALAGDGDLIVSHRSTFCLLLSRIQRESSLRVSLGVGVEILALFRPAAGKQDRNPGDWLITVHHNTTDRNKFRRGLPASPTRGNAEKQENKPKPATHTLHHYLRFRHTLISDPMRRKPHSEAYKDQTLSAQ